LLLLLISYFLLDGTTSLILDIYKNGKRSYEFLKNLQLPAGNSPFDRQTKKENLELAKKIAVARAHQLHATEYLRKRCINCRRIANNCKNRD
jgi:hypothetical protein